MGRLKDHMQEQLAELPECRSEAALSSLFSELQPERQPEDVIADYMDNKEEELWEFLTEANRSV